MHFDRLLVQYCQNAAKSVFACRIFSKTKYINLLFLRKYQSIFLEYQQLKALCNMENRSRQQGQISGGRRTTSRNSNHNTNLNANHACVEELSKTKSAMEGQLFSSLLSKHLLPARLSTTMLLRWLWNNLTSQPAIVTLQDSHVLLLLFRGILHDITPINGRWFG